jgi:hypothetical protein
MGGWGRGEDATRIRTKVDLENPREQGRDILPLSPKRNTEYRQASDGEPFGFWK